MQVTDRAAVLASVRMLAAELHRLIERIEKVLYVCDISLEPARFQGGMRYGQTRMR